MATGIRSKKSLCLELGEDLLAKLTHESPEIRLRALDQIETRFIRCIQNQGDLNFSPVVLLKQLIRWFAYTPPLIADRVLALMLELLRSKYRGAIIRKINKERLSSELQKIRQQLQSLNEKRPNAIMNDLESFVPSMYVNETLPKQHLDIPKTYTEQCNTNEAGLADVAQLHFNIVPDDYEEPWEQPSAADFQTIKTMVDIVTSMKDSELPNYLTQLQIKMNDYPVEYLLQEPHMYLRILHMQLDAKDDCLKQINFTISAFLMQLQQRIMLRSQTLSYAAKIDRRPTERTQLRLTKAMSLLFSNCLKLFNDFIVRKSCIEWSIFEVIIETIRTFEAITEPVAAEIGEQCSTLVNTLMDHCKQVNCQVIEEAMIEMTLPRLNLMILNGLLQDIIILNMMFDQNFDKTAARTLIKPLIWDSVYLSCVPSRRKSLTILSSTLSESIQEEEQIKLLRSAYCLAINQLHSTTQLNASRLLKAQRTICLVVSQLGSVELIDQLFRAIVTCTPLFGKEKKLREEAESLLNTLFDLPNDRLRCSFFKMMKRPVVEHFHAIMTKTIYMQGCNTTELVKSRILGIPLNTMLLRKLLVNSFSDKLLEVQQISTDCIIMLLKLGDLLDKHHISELEELLWRVIPQMVACGVKQPQIHQHLWEQLNPDVTMQPIPIILVGNICYMFHRNIDLRKEATARVIYLLRCQDMHNTLKPVLNSLVLSAVGPDLCVVHPPHDYVSFFTHCSGNQSQHDSTMAAVLNIINSKDININVRKSSLIQLNVLLQDWHCLSNFAKEQSFKFALDAICAALKADSPNKLRELLPPSVSILLKTLLFNPAFCKEITRSHELYVCLLRVAFLSAHETQLRHDVSICVFLMLYCDYFRATASTFTLSTNLSEALHVPLKYVLDLSGPPSAATEGLDIEKHLAETFFCGNAVAAKQHWRLFVSNRILQMPGCYTLEPLQTMNISEKLKLKPIELALMLATQTDQRMACYLKSASNCSNHSEIQLLIGYIQVFLVLKRDRLSCDLAITVWELIHRFLRIAPGNAPDQELYIILLELCLNCLHHQLPQIIEGLNLALETDPHHSFLVLLDDRTLSVEVLYPITKCLIELLRQPCHNMNWHGKLFMQLSLSARLNFELRKLLYVRCQLGVLRALSEHPLNLSDGQLSQYCQSFIQLSSDLHTSTQTGAQWQRDCLYTICHLQSQTSDEYPMSECFKIKTIRYILSLCGHCDTEVRALAWVAVSKFISKNLNKVGIVLSELKVLPGGLPACCLVTLLDTKEAMILRAYAGRVFEMLMMQIDVDQLVQLLHRHSFMKEADAALNAVCIKSTVSKEFDYWTAGAMHSCDIINCFVGICVRLVRLLPNWSVALCKENFMNGLCDLLKMTPPVPCSEAYYQMWKQICNLYSLLCVQQFGFLQRTICRDQIFLKFYLQMLDNVADLTVSHSAIDLDTTHAILCSLLNMLMIFCKDDNSYGFLVEQLELEPRALIKVLMHSLDMQLYGTMLQQLVLSVLMLLLIKSQADEGKQSVLNILEAYMIPACDRALPSMEKLCKPNDNKENNSKALNQQMAKLSLDNNSAHIQKTGVAKSKPKDISCEQKRSGSESAGNCVSGDKTSIIVVLYQKLDRLFEHNFPCKTYCFISPVTTNSIQACEALGVLLKLSQPASDFARQCKLLNRILHLIENFLNDSNLGDACAYVRRVGAHKTRDLLNNLEMFITLLFHWHSSQHAIITDTPTAVVFIRILVRMWPWLSHLAKLKQLVVRLTSFLTEHSFEMCKQASIVLPGQPHSLLQLMVRVADHETTRKESLSSEHNKISLDAVLRVMINCCSCAEGRLSLAKMHVLDIFSTILPGSGNISQALKVRPDALKAWLTFWDVYSRYDIGAKVCHLHALVNTVQRSPARNEKRLLCLRILRNICFIKENRTQLVGMTQLLDMMCDILTQPITDAEATNERDKCGKNLCAESFYEQYLVGLSIWKLFGFGAKYKAMLRGTKLQKHMKNLCEELTILEQENQPVFQSLPYAGELQEILQNMAHTLRK